MEIDPRSLSAAAAYRLLIGCVVPRPIAWVSTLGPDGIPNLAPFSFFMAVCADPLTLAFSAGPRGGSKKDTIRNLEHTREFVVNVVDDTHAEPMNLTSGEYPPEVDEFALAGLQAAPGVVVRAPRLADTPIAMECRVTQVTPVGRGPHSLVLGEVVYLHVRDDLFDPRTGRIDVRRLQPVGRLGGELYAHVHDIFELKRPNPDYRG